ncbi:MAG TPA: glycosyltransferase family 2 protein [Candidatus Saccharimonadia bacterium]|nr:glycosyltransferase family 2 protein [Candidatus Saccharimonadia bacterium]
MSPIGGKMKLVIMIPCLNEEKTLPLVFSTMPKKIDGIDEIETLIIDDGSTDDTYEVAKKLGVRHFVRHKVNQGLAYSFRDGIKGSLELGADIIVITDGDNQYPQERIPDLIKPILDRRADVVIADRQTSTIEHFSLFKKVLQKFGTWVLNKAARTNVLDGTSGFRAYSKSAAIQLNLIAPYSFATETIIQSGNKNQKIGTITIKTNPKTRESRVMKSSITHARKSGIVILRSLMMYEPYTIFGSIGLFLLIVGLIPFGHYLFLVLTVKSPNGPHHLQSLLIGGVFLTGSFISFTLGMVADLIRVNRIMIEEILENQKKELYK